MPTSEQYKGDIRAVLQLGAWCLLAILYFGQVWPAVMSFWLTLYGNAIFQIVKYVYAL